MRRGGGKAKGSAFERLVCKQLSLWMSHDTREDLYWRSAMSGGRATVAASKGTRLAAQAGDISAIAPEGEPLTRQFLIECKNYRNLRFAGLTNGTGELSTFWARLKIDAADYAKRPLLIAKQNGYKPIVCVDRKGLEELVLKLECVLTAPKQNFYAIPFNVFISVAKRPS